MRGALMRGVLPSLLALAAAAPAMAEPALVRPCGERDTIESLAEPWEENTATLAKGAVRIAVIDRGEPAAAAMELLVLTPPADEAGYRVCRVVAAGEAGGFAGIDFAERSATYDASQGLVVDMPARVAEAGGTAPRQLTVTIRQDTGAVDAVLRR